MSDRVELMLGVDGAELQKGLQESVRNTQIAATAMAKALVGSDQQIIESGKKRSVASKQNMTAEQRELAALEDANRRIAKAQDEGLAALKKNSAEKSKLFDGLRSKVLQYAAAYASIRTVQNAISNASELKDDAEAYRINIVSLQTLRRVTEDNGAKAEHLNKALQSLQKRTVEAANGNEQYKKSFERLGLNIENLLKLPVEEQLQDMSRAYVASGEGAESYGAIMKILGDQVGPKMIGTLKAIDSEGLTALNQRMRESGRILDKEIINQLDVAGKKFEVFTSKAQNAISQSLGELLTFGQAIGRQMSDVFSGKFDGNVFEHYENIRHDDMMTLGNAEAKRKNRDAEVARLEAEIREQEAAEAEITKAQEKELEKRKQLKKKYDDFVVKSAESARKAEENKRKKDKEAEQKYWADYTKLRDDAIEKRIEALRDLAEKEDELRKQKLSDEMEITNSLRDQLELRKALTEEIANSTGNGTGDSRSAQRIVDLRDRADQAASAGNFERAGRLGALAEQREENLFNLRRQRFNDSYNNERDPNRRAQMLDEGRRQGFDKKYKSLKDVQGREKKEEEEKGKLTKDEKDKVLKSISKIEQYVQSLGEYLGKATSEIESSTTINAGTGNAKRPAAPVPPRKPS